MRPASIVRWQASSTTVLPVSVRMRPVHRDSVGLKLYNDLLQALDSGYQAAVALQRLTIATDAPAGSYGLRNQKLSAAKLLTWFTSHLDYLIISSQSGYKMCSRQAVRSSVESFGVSCRNCIWQGCAMCIGRCLTTGSISSTQTQPNPNQTQPPCNEQQSTNRKKIL